MKKKTNSNLFMRTLHKGVIKAAEPVRQNRSAIAPYIYLPMHRTIFFLRNLYFITVPLCGMH